MLLTVFSVALCYRDLPIGDIARDLFAEQHERVDSVTNITTDDVSTTDAVSTTEDDGSGSVGTDETTEPLSTTTTATTSPTTTRPPQQLPDIGMTSITYQCITICFFTFDIRS